MIYLTFDSNIWIYSLDDSWKIENHLDYIEPWIEEGQIKLLLPEIILNEWAKHRSDQVNVRKDKLKEFFRMAEEIMPTAFFSDYKSPEAQNNIIVNQLNRIDRLVKNAKIVPINDDIQKKVIQWGVDKLAPMHRKSSLADTIIVLSLIDYAEKNHGHDYKFISANSEDFYVKKEGKSVIHPDLEPDFKRLNIKEYKTLNHLIHELISFHNLPVSSNISQKRQERIKNKIRERIYNPEYENLVSDQDSQFIKNVETIDFILRNNSPTKEQVIFIFALIDSDTAYEREFYRKLDNGKWFKLLLAKGAFNHHNNPPPRHTIDGLQIPFWQPLVYLEKLSEQIREGKEQSIIDDIINLVKHISENPIDNPFTWEVLIKVLTCLPNEKVSTEVLSFIPVWFSSQFDTIHQSPELCGKLLPKFLSENPDIKDIEKAENILKYIFSVDNALEGTIGRVNPDRKYGKYRSKVDLHTLLDSFKSKELSKKIAKYCSNNLLIFLAGNLKKIFFEFPKEIDFSIEGNADTHLLTIVVGGKDLTIFLKEGSDKNVSLEGKKVIGFENYDEQKTRELIINELKDFNINFSPTENNNRNIDIILNYLMNGGYHSFYFDSVSELNWQNVNESNISDAFSLIFKEILNEKAKLDSQQTLRLLNFFLHDNYYRHPFFRRVAIFVIGENWLELRSLFWNVLTKDIGKFIFSDYNFEKDLYELLDKNQVHLTKEEISQLQDFIELGPQFRKNTNDIGYSNYWKLRWYSALRNTPPFNIRYRNYSESVGYTNKHFEDLGKVTVRSGSVSPHSEEEILKLTNEEILSLIHEFKPQDRREEPSIEGLAKILEKAVVTDPQKFSEEINLYGNIPYVYTYHILLGFQAAFKNQKITNWQNVLDFCNEYLSNENVEKLNLLHLEYDGWGGSINLVVSSVARLISRIMHAEDKTFDKKLLAATKGILINLSKQLKPIDGYKNNLDYPTFLINSTSGNVLIALLDYSLRFAKRNEADEGFYNWEPDVKSVFEESLKKGIIEGYIIQGMYFQQFYYLDKEWILNQIKANNNVEKKRWRAFMGGFMFGSPPSNEEVYRLMYHHYEKAISSNENINNIHNEGIIRHIVAFYFWGYEDLEKKGLVYLFINNVLPKSIVELINFIWRQRDYFEGLQEDERDSFLEKIIFLWEFIAGKFEDLEDADEGVLEIKMILPNLLVFAPEVNGRIASLIIKSAKYLRKHFYTRKLLENLNLLKIKGERTDTALYIGEILGLLPVNPYYSNYDTQNIVDLVTFLYENGQSDKANDFCNRLAKNGNDFLTDVYKRFNS